MAQPPDPQRPKRIEFARKLFVAGETHNGVQRALVMRFGVGLGRSTMGAIAKACQAAHAPAPGP